MPNREWVCHPEHDLIWGVHGGAPAAACFPQPQVGVLEHGSGANVLHTLDSAVGPGHLDTPGLAATAYHAKPPDLKAQPKMSCAAVLELTHA